MNYWSIMNVSGRRYPLKDYGLFRYKEDYDTLRRTQPELQVSLHRGRWLLRIRVLL